MEQCLNKFLLLSDALENLEESDEEDEEGRNSQIFLFLNVMIINYLWIQENLSRRNIKISIFVKKSLFVFFTLLKIISRNVNLKSCNNKKYVSSHAIMYSHTANTKIHNNNNNLIYILQKLCVSGLASIYSIELKLIISKIYLIGNHILVVNVQIIIFI